MKNDRYNIGIKNVLLGLFLNFFLVVFKLTAGILGNSFALVADSIESLIDIISSALLYFGLKLAGKPPDESHPYGHGKFEPLAATLVGVFMFGASILIGIESVRMIITPQSLPKSFTLIVLAIAILLKEFLFRKLEKVSKTIESSALNAEAWHHRSDALSSGAAFLGITIALIGGKGYESADSFAALVAAFLIAINSIIIFRPALLELLDTAPSSEILEEIRTIAQNVEGVVGTHQCHVRKIGLNFYVDLDVLCDPNITVRQGHTIAHKVGEAIQQSITKVTKVLVHIEPADDYGRFSV